MHSLINKTHMSGTVPDRPQTRLARDERDSMEMLFNHELFCLTCTISKRTPAGAER